LLQLREKKCNPDRYFRMLDARKPGELTEQTGKIARQKRQCAHGEFFIPHARFSAMMLRTPVSCACIAKRYFAFSFSAAELMQ
jgi:hypothetical protein